MSCRTQLLAVSFILTFLGLLPFRYAQASTVSINVSGIETRSLSIIGDTPPLSLDTPLPLIRKEDGFHVSLWFPSAGSGEQVKFKFVTVDQYDLTGTPEFTPEPLQGYRVLTLTRDNIVTAHTYGVPDPLEFSEDLAFTPAQLQEDLALFNRVIQEIHPGATRYLSAQEWQAKIDSTQRAFQQALSVKETYLTMTRLAASLQCGHTHTGMYNQTALIDQLLQGSSDKLPLLFANIRGRWVITHNASNKSLLKRGTEIISINGRAVSEIATQMMPYLSADGANQTARDAQVALYPVATLQFFDAYFPLLFNQDDRYKLEVRLPNTDRTLFIDVAGTTLVERERRLAQQGVNLEALASRWNYAITEGTNIGYLKLGTYAVYNMDFDWRAFLAEAFSTFNAQGVDKLVVDIRGNVGGLDEVRATLDQYLGLDDIDDRFSHYSKYQVIDPSLRPYLATWDSSFYDLSNVVSEATNPLFDGYMARTREVETVLSSDQESATPSNDVTFAGDIALLIDNTNSSATFYQALAYQGHPRVTLMGTPTGGNRKGINGGGVLFFTLPNTQIEIDIPLFASIPEAFAEQPNRGVIPDVIIERTIKDIELGRDGVLERAIQTWGAQ